MLLPFDTANYVAIFKPFLATIVESTIMNLVVVAFS